MFRPPGDSKPKVNTTTVSRPAQACSIPVLGATTDKLSRSRLKRPKRSDRRTGRPPDTRSRWLHHGVNTASRGSVVLPPFYIPTPLRSSWLKLVGKQRKKHEKKFVHPSLPSIPPLLSNRRRMLRCFPHCLLVPLF